LWHVLEQNEQNLSKWK